MKLSSDPRARAAHGRQNNNNKSITEGNTQYKMMSMGDGPVQPNSTFSGRSFDSVSCWGDVPKHSTRLIEILNEMDTSPGRNPSHRSGPIASRTVERHSETDLSNVTAKLSGKSKQPVASSAEVTVTTAEKLTSGANSKNSGTAGREKLLEWLRTSQAKRDENNRLVFSRWIDRLGSMNTQEAASPTVSHNAGGLNSADFQQTGAPLLSPPAILSGLFATPTLVMSNPIGLMTSNYAFSRLGNSFPHTAQTTYGSSSLIMPPNFSSNVSFTTNVSPNLLNTLCTQQSNELAQPAICVLSTTESTDPSRCDILPRSHNAETLSHDSKLSSYSPEYSTSNVHQLTENISVSPNTSLTVSGESETENKEQTNVPFTRVYPPVQEVPLTSNGVQHNPYYLSMPLVSDSLIPQMYYYQYCYQNQSQNALPKQTCYSGSPLVYFVPQSQLSSSGQPVYYPTTYICTPGYRNSLEPMTSFDLADKQSNHPQDDKLTETLGYISSVQSGDFNTNVTDSFQKESNSAPSQLESAESSVQTAADYNITSTLDFDMNQWYSVLGSINSDVTMETPSLVGANEQPDSCSP
ncbi:hypothetical protein CRM22_000792 [Opisthorchis felineus]|uniref:Uncharacterized protein n=1 Tax=Opisthorchis felineus TaxID=147828 RepID=A0A4S2MHX3_OPIFE|nr:hypothetical protein CRM22_000792 [Opisthorchis felineus]